MIKKENRNLVALLSRRLKSILVHFSTSGVPFNLVSQLCTNDLELRNAALSLYNSEWKCKQLIWTTHVSQQLCHLIKSRNATLCLTTYSLLYETITGVTRAHAFELPCCAAWNHWQEKWLTAEYRSFILELNVTQELFFHGLSCNFTPLVPDVQEFAVISRRSHHIYDFWNVNKVERTLYFPSVARHCKARRSNEHL